jgi:hypothetical protein
MRLFYLAGLVIILSSPALAARTKITGLVLENPELSAGDFMNLKAQIQLGDDATRLVTSGIYLGMITQNAFPNADALNRTIEHAGEDRYRVTDLQINPWVEPRDGGYTIEEFYVFDDTGYRAALQAPFEGCCYYNQHGSETDIPVIRFSVRPNPQADFTRPRIHALSATKESYLPGEKLMFRVEASDDRSGVKTGAGGGGALYGVTVDGAILGGRSHSDRLQELSPGVFATAGNVKLDPACSEDRFPIWSFLVSDRAGNWGGLIQLSPEDEFYADSNTHAPTAIPVVWIQLGR